jgi:hypothetical protein
LLKVYLKRVRKKESELRLMKIEKNFLIFVVIEEKFNVNLTLFIGLNSNSKLSFLYDILYLSVT